MIKTKLKDLFLIKNIAHKDYRGYFKELIRENKLGKKFPFLVMSFSKKGVIRGMHLQTKKSQGKFVSVIKGKIFDVVIDLRKNSKTFGKQYHSTLSEKNSKSIYIPPGFAHGFQALDEKITLYMYKTRDQKSEVSINCNDKYLKIKWPLKKKIISKR